MTKPWGVAKWALAVLGGAIVVAIQTSPDVATSNVALWVERITGFLPDWPRSVDLLATGIGLLLLASPFILMLRRSRTKSYRLTDRGLSSLARIMAGGPQSDASQSPLLFAGLREAKNTPQNDWTAIRLVVRNNSDHNLDGLVARLVRADPELGSLNGTIDLPLILSTKGRLDRLRNPAIQEQIPHHGFNLHAHSEKEIEVVWLHSKGALEGYITHEAGQADFLFVGPQELYVQLTGAGHPIEAGVRIEVADDDQQSWKPILIIEAAAHAHGQAGFG